ncbi:hypothetical protein [Okeania sp. SIO1F9]|uniref:hypothetical protein n=1 Tax=Okeania sp. SIO1F9 TaxID=2607813 RepID=UPI00144C6339|nr:hypothetical protein [Okeania sp. SIO1F9]NET76700.1 hypothetical protein [Okeania sp. SIO1F9]
MDDLNLTFMQIQPGSTISGIVAGFVDNGEDFTLNFSGGSTIVDTSPLDANQLGLNIGDPVNVLVAEFDGLEIDTIFMTRPDNSIILGSQTSPVPPPPQAALDPITGGIANPPSPAFNPVIPPQGNPIFSNTPTLEPPPELNPVIPPQGNPIFGTVLGIVDNDEFLLQDGNGTQILVDADLPDNQFLNVVPGEQVNVVGIFDNDNFDAFSITRPDGSVIFSNTPTLEPPPEFNPVIPPQGNPIFSNTPILPPPPELNPIIPPQGNPIFGTVAGIVDNDEFFWYDDDDDESFWDDNDRDDD